MKRDFFNLINSMGNLDYALCIQYLKGGGFKDIFDALDCISKLTEREMCAVMAIRIFDRYDCYSDVIGMAEDDDYYNSLLETFRNSRHWEEKF